MKSLITGIKAHFDGDAALVAALSGGLWLNTVPQGTAPPYASFEIPGGSPEEYSSMSDVVETALVRFVLYSQETSAEEIEDIYELLRARFDEAMFAVDDYDFVRCRRINQTLDQVPGGWWEYTVDYEIWIQEG